MNIIDPVFSLLPDAAKAELAAVGKPMALRYGNPGRKGFRITLESYSEAVTIFDILKRHGFTITSFSTYMAPQGKPYINVHELRKE